MHRFRCKKGFTLVEVSIVLVILGIILTTIIKGGEVLRAGRIKSLLMTQNDLHQALLAYREKFGYLPGDDPLASTHVGAAPAKNGDGLGGIEANEATRALNHLQLAGLIAGNYDGDTAMPHYFGGTISFINYPFKKCINYDTATKSCTSTITISIPAAVYTNLPYDVAQALETAVDGPEPFSITFPPSTTLTTVDFQYGSVQATSNYTSANPQITSTYVALYPVAP